MDIKKQNILEILHKNQIMITNIQTEQEFEEASMILLNYLKKHINEEIDPLIVDFIINNFLS